MNDRISSAKSAVTKLLAHAGIQINGSAPSDIHIHNDNFYDRVIRDQLLGLGESYMEGWWDCQRIDLFIAQLATSKVERMIKMRPAILWKYMVAKIYNFQNKNRAFEVGQKHYDIGNDLFQMMLDTNMNYSCGYWKTATTLEQAQLDKMDLVCKKLMLTPGMRVLDIGCGFGSFARFAAENYGVEVVGITISKQQYEFAKNLCKNLPIEILIQDYRSMQGSFDRIVSIGMFEHVGHLNYKTYMDTVHNCLADDGLFLLHTIGGNVSTTRGDPWIAKYIFPNGMIPSIAQIGKATEQLLIMEDWHNFGPDYYKTLMSWHQNFNQGWDKISNKYDQQFFRQWNYYLQFCAGGFKARDIQLWQIVFSKKGLKDRYEAPR